MVFAASCVIITTHCLFQRNKPLRRGCPTRGPPVTFGPRSCFVWPARSFCVVHFLMKRLTILWQIKRRSKPKPSFIWFYQNQFRFATEIFFLSSPTFGDRFPENWPKSPPIYGVDLFFGFHLLLEKIPEILTEVSTDFVQQTCNYLEFNLGKNACGPQ